MGIVIAAAVVGVAVWLNVSRSAGRPSGPPDGQWFYDVSTGQLTVASRDAIPPIQTPTGGEAVRARVYGCGSCSQADRKVAVLEKYPPKVVEELESPLPVDPESEQAAAHYARRDQLRIEALLIASPPAEPGGDIAWTPQEGPGAAAVMEAAEAVCGGAEVQICLPE